MNKPKYPTAESLWAVYEKYEKKTLEELIVVKSTSATFNSVDKSEIITVAKPLTLFSFMAFAGICNWARYKTLPHTQGEDYQEVIETIETRIKAQQVEGALTGQYNSNLTARLNAITEKTEVTTKQKVKLVLGGE